MGLEFIHLPSWTAPPIPFRRVAIQAEQIEPGNPENAS